MLDLLHSTFRHQGNTRVNSRKINYPQPQNNGSWRRGELNSDGGLLDAVMKTASDYSVASTESLQQRATKTPGPPKVSFMTMQRHYN